MTSTSSYGNPPTAQMQKVLESGAARGVGGQGGARDSGGDNVATPPWAMLRPTILTQGIGPLGVNPRRPGKPVLGT